MAEIKNDNLDLRAPKPLDERTMKFESGIATVYSSVAEANSMILYRNRTLTVPILISGQVVEHWYENGTTDSDLVPKFSIGIIVPDGLTATPPINKSGAITIGSMLTGFIKGTLSGGFTSVSAITNADITSLNFSKLTSKPSTIGGYGITDAQLVIPTGSTNQYYRGDKTFQTLNKASVGLPNADDTSDANKPVSIATQAILDTKVGSNSPSLTGIPTAPTATQGTNTNQIATVAFVNDAVVASTTGVASFNGRTGAISPSIGDYTFSQIGSKPTTVAGYGIVDALTQASADARYSLLAHTHTFSSITSRPTTLSGYGITDAAPLVHTHVATSITEDSSHRWTTDTEKSTWNAKQSLLVSGTNIKTINGNNLLGSGNIVVNIPVDTIPTNNSVNAVQSGGTFNALATKVSLNGIETITNKTISGSSNNLTNLSASSLTTGNLSIILFGGGTGASSSTYWRGDGTWASPTGSGSSEVSMRTLAGLRAETSPTTAVRYYSSDAGKEGFWYYDSSDTTTSDNTGLVLVSSNGKRFKRIYDGINVDVKWFDILGNGTNESVKLQNAVNYTSGKNLWFQNVTIRTYGLNVTGDNRKFIGNNGIIKYISAGAQPDIFWYVASNNFTMDNLEFDMESLAGSPTSGTTVLYFDSCDKLDIKNNYIHDNGHAAIKIVGGSSHLIDGNRITNTDSSIFCLADPSGGASDLVITKNIIDGGTSEGIGVFSHSDPSLVSKRWIVSNNVVKNKTTSAAFNLSRSKYGIVVGNIVSNCYAVAYLQDSGSGFNYDEFSTDIDFIGNHFSDIVVGINNASDRCSIKANTFHNIWRTAILTNGHPDINGNPHNITVTGLIIENNSFHNGAYENQAFPIIDLQDLRKSSIRNNTFSESINNSVKAFRCYNLDDVVLEGNNAWDSKLEMFSSDTASYGKHLIVRTNLFRDVDNTVVYPITGSIYNWLWENNHYKDYETDPTNILYDLTPSSGALDINSKLVRDNYYIASSQTITSIRQSWFGRQITLTSKGAATITHGSNISLVGSINFVMTANQSITLRYDGATWREKYRSTS